MSNLIIKDILKGTMMEIQVYDMRTGYSGGIYWVFAENLTALIKR